MASTKLNVRPLGDRVLVKATDDAPSKTKGGIIIPDTVDKGRPERGEVVAVGEGRVTDEGKVIAPRVKPGDIVLFSKYGPDEVKIDGKEYFILRESDILAVVKK